MVKFFKGINADKKSLMALAALALFALISMQPAFAFEFTGSCGDAFTQCELGISNLEVCNYSDEFEELHAVVSGPNEWMKIIPTNFSLESGECRQMETFFISSCLAEPGKYFYDITVSNDFSQTIRCVIDLKQGHRVEVEITPERQEATQCQEKIYDVAVTARSDIEGHDHDLIDLTVSGFPGDWGILKNKEFELRAGETKHTELKVKAPCDAKLGEYDFTVKGTIRETDFSGQDSAQYVLIQGQKLDIELGIAGNELTACVEREMPYFINLKNNGVDDAAFNLALEGPEFAKLGGGGQSVSIQAGTSKDVKLTLGKSSEGSFEAKLKASSAKFNYSAEKSFTIKAIDCYDVKLEVKGNTDVCTEDPQTYMAKITNNSIEKINVNFSVKGSKGEISKQDLTLEKGESKETTFRPDFSLSEGSAELETPDVLILTDSSGSMVEKASSENNSKTKIMALKDSLNGLVYGIRGTVNLGLREFGQGNECEASRLIVPVKEMNVEKTIEGINSLAPRGLTPLFNALEASANDFSGSRNKAIIIVSDGKETCNGKIEDAIKALTAKSIKVYAIGFDMKADAKGRADLQELAFRSDGKYFDAQNSDELLSTVNDIARELKIIPSESKDKTLEFTALSEYAKDSQSMKVSIEDCINSALFLQELNLCKGVEHENSFLVRNLGTQSQEFDSAIVPSWIELTQESNGINVPAKGELTVPFTASTPLNETIDEYTVALASARQTLKQTKAVNFLPNETCFGIDLITTGEQLDATHCEGQIHFFFIENQGVIAQKVTLESNKPWVYIAEKEITLAKGERKKIEFYVSPPNTLAEPLTELIITAKTDHGFESSASIDLIKTGIIDPAEKIDVQITDGNKVVEIKDYSIAPSIEFSIENNSSRYMRIEGLSALGFEAKFNIENTLIEPHKSTKIAMQVTVPNDANGEVIVPVKITTNQGTYVRTVTLQVKKLEQPQQGETFALGSGLLGLGVGGILLGLMVLLLIALIAIGISYYRHRQEEKKEGEESETQAAGIREITEETSYSPVSEKPEKEKKSKAKKAVKKKRK